MKKSQKSSAKRVESPIVVYTDGSCMKSKTSHKCGYGVYFPNKEYPHISRKFIHDPLTNQRAELYAIYKAIKTVNDDDTNKDIHIFSDSEYSIKSLTVWIKQWKNNNWKTANNKEVMNQDIIRNIDALMLSHKGKIKFTHVRSHTGKDDEQSKYNDKADALAKAGANIS
uniref:ribonuclease H n=1 Tax=viral metagenome TaxID=1070528 RepID=A0A6C0E964_9ZZZZ